MSLLDENLDIDIIHTVALKYLNSIYMYYNNINLKKGYYRFDENGESMIEYDNKPENWFIMKKMYTNEFYITRWVNSNNRYIYNLYLVKIQKGSGQLKYLIDEFIRSK